MSTKAGSFEQLSAEQLIEEDDNNNIDLDNRTIDIITSDKANNVNTSPPQYQSQERIDTKALNGLRGVVAVHILIFHALIFSKWQINILGSVQMPLFFLISGFILALNDGKTIYKQTKCCTEMHSVNDDENPPKFDGKNFYQRRIARTMPLYYLTNIIVIPLIYLGYHSIQPGDYSYISLTIFAATTWIGIPILLNGPSWFVSTIWFFYWIFPSLVPKLQQYSTEKKQSWLCYHFWIQLVVGLFLFFGLLFTPLSGLAFYISTFWPPSRLPIFIMGILAGLLRNESIALSPICCCVENEINYKQRCDIMTILFVIFFVLGSFIESITKGASGWNLYGQFIMPWFQMHFIYALTSDDGMSRIYKILSSKLLLYLGRISYALYLVHWPIICYICWVVYGTQSKPTCNEEDDGDQCKNEWDTYRDNQLMPIWAIPIHIVISFILAIILNILVEEPMRKWLRPSKKY